MHILEVSGVESLGEMQVAHLSRQSKGQQFFGSDLKERYPLALQRKKMRTSQDQGKFLGLGFG